ncbi:hypothetical protein [Bradyrhizobium sp. SZCCHNR1015]|uniref:hypothetical protein n=1 Tax=Bradyrhizobium sp. SZCCHNR1015 TaxID=3057338 RepID=UPI0029169C0B|nr:hypothetical protein [Bradyrhizobium sp. SZCCHNR1015]
MEIRGCRDEQILAIIFSVMPGLVPGIHAAPRMPNDVDGRVKPGHDDVEVDERTTPIVKCDRLMV